MCARIGCRCTSAIQLALLGEVLTYRAIQQMWAGAVGSSTEKSDGRGECRDQLPFIKHDNLADGVAIGKFIHRLIDVFKADD